MIINTINSSVNLLAYIKSLITELIVSENSSTINITSPTISYQTYPINNAFINTLVFDSNGMMAVKLNNSQNKSINNPYVNYIDYDYLFGLFKFITYNNVNNKTITSSYVLYENYLIIALTNRNLNNNNYRLDTAVIIDLKNKNFKFYSCTYVNITGTGIDTGGNVSPYIDYSLTLDYKNEISIKWPVTSYYKNNTNTVYYITEYSLQEHATYLYAGDINSIVNYIKPVSINQIDFNNNYDSNPKYSLEYIVEGQDKNHKIDLYCNMHDDLIQSIYSNSRFKFENLELQNAIYHVKIDDNQFIRNLKVSTIYEIGTLTVSVDTSCLEATDFKVRCYRHDNGKFIGEYPLINEQCTITNLFKHDFYDLVLIDALGIFEYQTMSKRIAR